jgi:hypothetical protein
MVPAGVADPDPWYGAFLTFGSGILDGKNPDPWTGMNIPDHFFPERLETVIGLKILKFFDADPGSEMILTMVPGRKDLDPGIRDKHPGSANTGASQCSPNRISPNIFYKLLGSVVFFSLDLLIFTVIEITRIDSWKHTLGFVLYRKSSGILYIGSHRQAPGTSTFELNSIWYFIRLQDFSSSFQGNLS